MSGSPTSKHQDTTKMKPKSKYKQMEFDFVKQVKPSKEYNKRAIRGYRKTKIKLREEDSYEQLQFPFDNE